MLWVKNEPLTIGVKGPAEGFGDAESDDNNYVLKIGKHKHSRRFGVFN
jgi:hypothetical protein